MRKFSVAFILSLISFSLFSQLSNSSYLNPGSGFTSNLPIFVINTENGLSIEDEPKIDAHLGIINNGVGKSNSTDDPFTEYDGKIGIEIRGNSTARYPKKPYNIETRNSLGENLNVSILGMPAENDWVLRASYFDHTFLRNSLANHMARKTGYWASRSKHVEVIINGEYQGIYLFMESLKRDENRVDIAKLDSTDVALDDITGGYIWEINGRKGEDYFGEYRKIKYPQFEDITDTQLKYIRAFDDAFRNKMKESSKVYSDPNTGYVQHIWVESFIYEAIVQEAMRNSDAYGWSGFYHKDKNGLINAGPVWDFDQSAGNSSYPDNGVVDGWMIEHPKANNTPFYWSKLLNDPFFKYSLSIRWKELRANEFNTSKLIAYVDSIASLLSDAQIREFEKWPVLGEKIYRETIGFEERDTYQKEIDYLKDFLTERWDWIDAQLADVLKPDGFPSIIIENEIPGIRNSLAMEQVYLNVKNIFSYPYDSKLKYEAYSSDSAIVFPKVNKSDTLKFEINGVGICDISIRAIDIYGNKKDINFTYEVISTPVAVNEVMKNSIGKFTLYPNPASKNIYLKLDSETKGFIDLKLYSYSGQLVDRIYSGQYIEPLNYNISKLNNGVYFVQLKIENSKILIQKFIVNR